MINTFAVKTSLFTLILALIAIGTFAFTEVMNKQSVSTNKLQNTFHFVGDSEDPGQFSEIDNWREGTSNACGTVGQKPCEITVEANNLDELATYLSGMDNESVLDINPSSKRP